MIRASHLEDYPEVAGLTETECRARGVRNVAVGTAFRPVGLVWISTEVATEVDHQAVTAHVSPALARRIAHDLLEQADIAENERVAQQRNAAHNQ